LYRTNEFGLKPGESATLDTNISESTFLKEDDDEINGSLHTNIADVTVRSSVSMWDTAQSVAMSTFWTKAAGRPI
jgi:hypothetical protein